MNTGTRNESYDRMTSNESPLAAPMEPGDTDRPFQPTRYSQTSHSKQNFNMKDLTPEDRAILKNISKDANIYRGYPFAALCGGVTYFGIRTWMPKFSSAGTMGLALTAGIFGNVIGKLSYFPSALKSLQKELPPDSKLRQLLEAVEEQKRAAFSPPQQQQQQQHGFPRHPPFTTPQQQQQQQQSYPTNTPMPQQQQSYPTNTPTPQESFPTTEKYESVSGTRNKPHLSYSQMRKEHREQEKKLRSESNQTLQPDSTSQSEFVIERYNEPQKNKNVRYNKYGDPILD